MNRGRRGLRIGFVLACTTLVTPASGQGTPSPDPTPTADGLGLMGSERPHDAPGVGHVVKDVARGPESGAVEAVEPPGSLPIELAFSRRSLNIWDRPMPSPDGSSLAYGVTTPPAANPRRGMPEDVRYLPGGTPYNAVGARLHLVDVATGRTRPIGPENGNSWRPSWSPDGRAIAFLCDAGGSPQLWAYDVARGEPHRVSEAPLRASVFPGDEPSWDPRGREVFVRLRPPARPGSRAGGGADGAGGRPAVTVHRSGSEAGPAARDEAKPTGTADYLSGETLATLAAVDIDRGTSRVVVPADASPGPSYMRPSPSGRWVAFFSVLRRPSPTAFDYTFDWAVVPSGGGPARVVERDLHLPDDYFVGTYQWHPSRDLAVYYKDRRLWLLDLEGDEPRTRPLAEAIGAVAPGPFAFTRDGNAVLVRLLPADRGSPAGDRPASLALVPVQGGEPETVAIEAGCSLMRVVTARRGLLWQPRPGALTLVLKDDRTGESVVERVEPATGRRVALRKDRVGYDFIGSGGDHATMLAIRHDATTPPDLFRLDETLADGVRLTDVEPRLAGFPVGPMITLEVDAPLFDGRLGRVRTGVLLPPGGRRGDKLPAIVAVYGGAMGSEAVDQYGGGSVATIPAQVFASRGYAVLLPDMPIGPMGAGRDPSREMTDVLLPQVYHVAEQGYIDVRLVAVMGQSYGGYSAAAIATQTNLFRAAVAVNGSFDLPGLFGRMGPMNNDFDVAWSETGQGRMGTHPWGDLRRYLANSPYYQADKINTPLLLIQGGRDDADDARKMFNAAKRLGKAAELAVYEGEGHAIWDWSLPDAVDATRRVLDFLGRRLRAGRP